MRGIALYDFNEQTTKGAGTTQREQLIVIMANTLSLELLTLMEQEQPGREGACVEKQ